jgi:acetylornithine aminotransferase
MREVEPYPFEELDRRKKEALDAGREVIDLGVGDPRDPTPDFIREAAREAITPQSSYPRAAGLPALREAIVDWIDRRFDVRLSADHHVLPLLGSKELIFSLAQYVVDPPSGRNLVLVTAPGYAIPERGALLAGAQTVRLPLVGERRFLPDLDSIDEETWSRVAVLWLNYPNNPTGAVAPISFLEDAAELCRVHGALLASDEAYSEIWFGREAPASALQVGELSNLIVLNSLSKRSNMTGYRSGFAAGDAELIDALKRLRPSIGVTPQEFVQRASIAAWGDETHVEQQRQRYRDKRELFLALFRARGIEVVESRATFYLWVRVPGDRSSLEWAIELIERGGVVIAPGSFFGAEGEGFARLALVPTLAECRRAVAILDDLMQEVPA